MQVQDFDGKIHKLKLDGKSVNRADARQSRSNLHLEARVLLQSAFPAHITLEEVPIPIQTGKRLFLDFLVPLKRLAVEIQGQQHTKYVKHFHGNKAGFYRQKSNDAAKQEWCDLNSIALIKLFWHEDIITWKEKINEYK